MKSGVMEKQEFDVFELLEQNGLYLSPNMINLLKDLGYRDLRTLSQIEDSDSLQQAVRESFGEDPVYYKELGEEKQKALIGPKFWKNPGMFKFAPGEKATIASIKPLCLDLLAKMPLVVPMPISTSTCKSASNRKVIVPVSLNHGPASVAVVTTKKGYHR